MLPTILILAHHFPPLNRIGTLRLYAFAKYFAESGCKVVVLTTQKTTIDGLLTMDLPTDFCKVVSVHYGLRERSTQPPSLKNSQRLNRLREIVRFLRRHVIGGLFDVHDIWAINAYQTALRLVREEKIDVVLSSYSPLAPHYLAYRLKKKHPALFWVADYRDLWSLDHGRKPLFPFSTLQRFIEKHLNNTADLLVTVSNGLAETLRGAFPRTETLVIENGYMAADQSSKNSREPNFSAQHTIVYTGQIYPGKRDPEPFLIALKELISEGKIQANAFEIRFYGENVHILEPLIRKLALEKNVHLLPPVPYQDALLIQKNASALLFLEWGDPSAKGVITGKLFEYLDTGKPIIAVGIAANSNAADIIRQAKSGFICERNIPAIKSAILSVLNKETLHPDYAYIQQFRRDHLAKKLLAQIVDRFSRRPIQFQEKTK